MPPGLAAHQLETFRDQGYLVVHDVLDETDLAPVRAEYDALLDDIARRLHADGRLSSTHENCAFDDRYPQMIRECGDVFPEIDITLPVTRNLPKNPPVHLGPAVFNLLTNPKILDVVESVIGPEIYSNPTQHLRLKPPERSLRSEQARGYVGRTSWHQDLAGLFDEALDTDLLTVWIAVSDASEEQGCLVAIPGSHKSNDGKLTPHCPETQTAPSNYIAGRRLAKGPRVPLPVKKGGVVLLHKLTQHASLPNRSSDLRFAFDLRYQPIGQPTGRPAFPGFVARSRKEPEKALRGAEDWQNLWHHARDVLLTDPNPPPIYETARWEPFGGRPPC